jgi:hypothetical protein
MTGTFYAVGYKFGRWLDSVLMQRELGEGRTSAARGRSDQGSADTEP